jgi:hypothetical protein
VDILIKSNLIFDYIKRHPGITPGKLERVFGHCVAHHLAKLRLLGKVDYDRAKHRRYWIHRYYVAGRG